MVALHLFWSRAGVTTRFRQRALSLGLHSGAGVTAAVFPRSLQYTSLAQGYTEWKGRTGTLSLPIMMGWHPLRNLSVLGVKRFRNNKNSIKVFKLTESSRQLEGSS